MERKQGVEADEWMVRKMHGCASGAVEHPGWNGKRSAPIVVVYAAFADRLSTSDRGRMDDDGTAIPRMPRITEFLGIGNRGVELLACIMSSGIIRASTIS